MDIHPDRFWDLQIGGLLSPEIYVHKNVVEFPDTHTKTNIGGVSSTFRDSKTAPFKWRERLKKDEVLKIQVKITFYTN